MITGFRFSISQLFQPLKRSQSGKNYFYHTIGMWEAHTPPIFWIGSDQSTEVLQIVPNFSVHLIAYLRDTKLVFWFFSKGTTVTDIRGNWILVGQILYEPLVLNVWYLNINFARRFANSKLIRCEISIFSGTSVLEFSFMFCF